jgi:hypothetical protein
MSKILSVSLACMALALAIPGCSGDAGKSGADGMDGADGTKGVDGKNGANGTKGADGDDGADGMDGVNGKNGTNGSDGVDGADGTDGTNGTDGVDGMDGMDGVNGMDGMDGADGDAGVDGTQGPTGPSGIIDRTKLTGRFVIYPLSEQQGSGASGTVRFAEFVDGAAHGTLVTVRLTGGALATVDDTLRVSHIHYNSVSTGGSPAITLNKVDGFTPDGTAMSETLVFHVDATANNAADLNESFVAGLPITYDDLVGTGVMGSGTGFNGYVNVHVVSTDTVADKASTKAIAAGDIGKNY